MFKLYISCILTITSIFIWGIMYDLNRSYTMTEKYINSQMENLIQIDSLEREYDELLYQRIKASEDQYQHKIDSLSKVVRRLNNEVTRMKRNSIMMY